MNKIQFRAWLTLIITVSIVGCEADNYVPKPRGYLRFEYSEHNYIKSNLDCPFEFDYPDYAKIVYREDQPESCWFNMQFPEFRAKVHFSYKSVTGNLNKLVEDSRSFVYKHTIKASNIDRRDFLGNNEQVYATYYKIDGNAASAVQFTLTDSTYHFLRGALYFDTRPNEDSIAPALFHLEKDLEKMIQTFRWK